MNKYDNVAGNFYSGADLGIGYVKYIDTGYENPKLMNGTIAFNTGKTTTGLPDIEWNTWKAGLNRTDDPLGVNADALASKIGGEVKPVCTELNVSGTYKTQYTVGDELNLTGIKLTAKWSDGSTSKVDLKDVTVEGYDKNNADKQTITLSYGAAKAYITVTVAPKSTKIMVSVSILGDSKHGTTSTLHGLARGGLTSWVNVSGVEALVGKIATGDLFVGDSETKAAIEAKCAPDCVEMEGAAVSQIAAKNGVPCVILRAMSDNADEDGHEVLVVKKFSIAEYVATATRIVAAMVEAL